MGDAVRLRVVLASGAVAGDAGELLIFVIHHPPPGSVFL